MTFEPGGIRQRSRGATFFPADQHGRPGCVVTTTARGRPGLRSSTGWAAKPFACGVVLHPPIDAAVGLRNDNALAADEIERVELKVHPLVIELTGKKTPQTGLEGKFSIYHAVAVAFIEGAGGEKQFSDRAVRDPAVIALRGRVVPVVTPGIKPQQIDKVRRPRRRHPDRRPHPPGHGPVLERRDAAERRRDRARRRLQLT
jgi:2-methylcitrate dehydratase PrpD